MENAIAMKFKTVIHSIRYTNFQNYVFTLQTYHFINHDFSQNA